MLDARGGKVLAQAGLLKKWSKPPTTILIEVYFTNDCTFIINAIPTPKPWSSNAISDAPGV
jgi:hypothetical protein